MNTDKNLLAELKSCLYNTTYEKFRSPVLPRSPLTKAMLLPWLVDAPRRQPSSAARSR